MNKLLAIFVLSGVLPNLYASPVATFFSGDLRSNANFTSCGPLCSLNNGSTNGEFAQFSAVAVTFVVASAQQMSAVTYGFGGGTSLTGAVVAASGFEPYLSLFDASGNFLASTFSGTTCPPGANTISGSCFDVLLDGGLLQAGTYTIAISAWENMSLAENLGSGKLVDGFTGLGNLAGREDLHYGFDVLLSGGAQTPEPSTLLSALLGFSALGGARWWRSRRAE